MKVDTRESASENSHITPTAGPFSIASTTKAKSSFSNVIDSCLKISYTNKSIYCISTKIMTTVIVTHACAKG